MATGFDILQDAPELQQFLIHDVSQTGRQLGGGSYGTVEEIETNGLICAAKRLHAVLLEARVRNITDKFIEECRILSNLHHPHIVQFMGVCFLEGDEFPAMVMEFLPASLDGLLDNTPNIPISVKCSILCDVARGLRYLHAQSPPLIHRDLTARNVLLNSALVAKIADLGVARFLDLRADQLAATMTQTPGTPAYMPPEALEEIPRYSASIDVFSFGHLSLYTVIQVFPIPISSTFIDPGNPGVIMARSEIQRRMKFIQQLSQRLGYRHLLVHLVMHCLHNDPNQRPTANELLLQLEQVRAGIDDPYADMSRLEMMQALREKDTRIDELEAMVERGESVVEEDEDTDTGGLHNWLMQLRGQLRREEAQIRQLENELHEKNDEIEELQLELQNKDDDVKKHAASEAQQTVPHRRAHVRVSKTKPPTESGQEQQLLLKPTPAKPRVFIPVLHSATPNRKDQRSPSPKPRLLSPIQLPQPLMWKRCEDSPFATSGCQVILIKGKLYIGGGSGVNIKRGHIVMEYTPQTREWSELLAYQLEWFAMAAVNDLLVLAGGWEPSAGSTNEIAAWDQGCSKWIHPYPAMPTSRRFASAAGYKTWLIVAGGVDKYVLDTVEMLDTATLQWHTAKPLPMMLSGMTSSVRHDMWFLIHETKTALTVSLHTLISQASDPWKKLSPTPLENSTAIHLRGALVAVGGKDSKGMHSSAMYLYQPNNDTWVHIGELPTPLINCMCTLLPSGELITIGGTSEAAVHSRQVHMASITAITSL